MHAHSAGDVYAMGYSHLGELAGLPAAALASRIGQQGLRLQRLARGCADHQLVPQEEAFTLIEVTTLDSPLEMLDSLLFVLSPMLERLLHKAVERAYALRAVKLELQLVRAEPHAVQVRPAVPTQSRELLLKLLNLELQAHPPRAGILAVTLSAEAAEPQTAQRGLFQSQFPEPDRLELLLARLRFIAGEDNVGSPQLCNSHREDAFIMAGFRPSAEGTKDESPEAGRLALRGIRPPQAVRVNAAWRPTWHSVLAGRAAGNRGCRWTMAYEWKLVGRRRVGCGRVGCGGRSAAADPAAATGAGFEVLVGRRRV